MLSNRLSHHQSNKSYTSEDAAMVKLTMNLNDVAKLFRENGIPANAAKIADGISSGAYPFGRVVSTSENGRRTFEIWRVDVLAFLQSRKVREGA